MIGKVETIPALDAEEISVRPALIAVIASHDLHTAIGAPHAQRRLAPVAAVRADRAHVLHLPGPRLVAIRAGGERPHRANVDAHAALFAFQVIFFIRRDQRTHTAVLHA